MGDGVASYEPFGAYEALKRELIGGLTGRVLEIGVGRCANFGLLSAGVDWVGIEPSCRHRRRLDDGRVLPGVAEALPLPDQSVDVVLGTIVLCSVDSQRLALAETNRVLRPGGRYVFFEHVASPQGTWRHRGERLVAPVTRRLDHGCDPSRETWRALERAPFRTLDLRWFRRGRQRFIGGFAVA